MAAHSVNGRRDSVLVIEPGAGRPDLRVGVSAVDFLVTLMLRSI